MKTTELCIDQTWNGEPIGADERARVALRLSETGLRVEVDAPFHGDPPPAGAAGSTDRLWEHEVVELFLLGEDERYLELELGPHGHYLVLVLRGARQIQESGLPLAFQPHRAGRRWNGRTLIPASYLPPGLRALNATASHGQGDRRRHLASHPVPGPAPDFHRLDCFRAPEWQDAEDPAGD